MRQSLELHEKIFQDRKERLWQVALGIVVLRFQHQNGDRFDLEQPDGSLLKHVPGMQEILDKTFPCRFDMCHVGHLQNPANGNVIS